MDKLDTKKSAKEAESGSFAKGCLFGSFICLPIWLVVYIFFKKLFSH
ncbi:MULTISPECIES: hypothetical protein [Bacillus]|uniref:Uncharacterized protein n=1 Tax=Bacillus capparidis TaxID=1840411 RepID=A0ABS4CW20_9BACI|nr:MULTISPECIES: hypothetical protein [Bacillus]MBP1081769.1 hypothetical protein [Bacillus capparidis]MED1096420.1 hypothetical protein [Bacillus capparidis]